jgi:hypothetical protein
MFFSCGIRNDVSVEAPRDVFMAEKCQKHDMDRGDSAGLHHFNISTIIEI